MKEIQDIVNAYLKAQQYGKQSALATVVLLEGSAYRRAGARMLITDDGNLTGAISGGCLEGDALRKARLVMAQREPMLITYDTMDDDDDKLGVGLGCNGIIHILIEPIHAEEKNNPIELLKIILNKRQNAVLTTLFCLENRKAKQPGTCLLIGNGGLVTSSMVDNDLVALIANDALSALHTSESVTKTYFADYEYIGFLQFLKPSISLVIVGAGNDAIPLTKLAGVLGWTITVLDGRANYAVPERFPDAKRVIVARPEEVLHQVLIDENTVMVLMTHNYNYDIALLKFILPISLNYIGMLGPKKKLDRMINELEDSGAKISNEQLKNIYGPVGLDIGSETPEEIALAIMAEIKAVLSHRNGCSLKQRALAIHAPGDVEEVKRSA
jgi:xanthine dehydrogenase accessory factor